MSLVELARYTNRMEAEIVRGLLASAGLHAVTFDGAMNIADSAAFAIPVRLMVLDKDEAESRAVIAEMERGASR